MFKTMIATVSFAALAAAIAVGGAAAADKPVYGVLMKTLSNPFWGAMEQGVRAGAKEADVEYFRQAVEFDQAAEPQLNACNTMLEKKPVVMITAAINSTILLPCLKHANEMNPVVDLNNPGYHQEGTWISLSIWLDNERRGSIWSACSARRRRAAVVMKAYPATSPGRRQRAAETEEAGGSFLPGDWDLKASVRNITNDTLPRA